MNTFTAVDGVRLLDEGVVMVKAQNPVYLEQQDAPFEVETNEGLMTGAAGDYLAHDPLSGHVWPVSADYVALHYHAREPEPRPQLLRGDRFIESLTKAGILPDRCRSVEIKATCGEVVTLSYTVFGDERLTQIADDGVVLTPDELDALAR